MSYNDGEALILTAIRTHANFNSQNSGRNKFGLLNSGNSSYYAITEPGPYTVQEQGQAGIGASAGRVKKVRTWTCLVGIYQLYVDDGDTQADLEERHEEVIEAIEQYRRLADTTDTIQKARVTGGPEMEYVSFTESGPIWAKWVINVQWEEARLVAFAE